MAGAYVQSVTEYTGGDTAPVLTSVGVGNALIIINYANAGGTDPVSVDSDIDGALTKIFSGNDGGSGQMSAWWKNGVTAGDHTVTVDNNGNPINTILYEASGLSAFVSGSTLKSGFSGSASSNSLTPAVGDYILGIIANNNSDFINSMTTCTERVDMAAGRGLAVGDYTAPSTSGVTVGGSLSGGSGFWLAAVLRFTVSGGGGGATAGGPILRGRVLTPGRIFGGSALLRQRLAFAREGRVAA